MKLIFHCFALSLFVSSASAVTIIPGLIGGDLTDRDDVHNEAAYNPPGNFGGFDATFDSNKKAFFNGGEGAFNIFDNSLGGGNSKLCCDGASWWVSAELASPFILTHFTVASNNDSIGRNPDVWQIQGSNDGSSWTDIFSQDADNAGAPGNRTHTHAGVLWTGGNQVLRFDGDGADFARPAAYTHFRINMESAGGWAGSGGEISIGELELFGVPEPSSTFALAGLAGLGLLVRRRR